MDRDELEIRIDESVEDLGKHIDEILKQLEESLDKIYKGNPLHKKVITITKLSDNPNPTISKGESVTGVTFGLVKGHSCLVDDFCTSIVKEIDFDKQIFKTLNSVYKYEINDNNP